MSRVERVSIIGIFFGFFSLYVHTCAPQLAPYRDAGEMASLLATLGVAHPPGYPLYTLIGRLSTLLPLGNIIYRANIFSALCAAGALVFLFLILRTWLGKFPSLAAACFLGFSNPFWDLATVSEMYALGALLFCLLLFVLFRREDPLLFSFLMALGLGARMDMLLLVPIFLVWFWIKGERQRIPWMAAFFAAGASVFLYLMYRSLTNPVIDWANPDNLVAVLNSARRKNYSGTLDLLSLSYQPGENFLINLRLYGQHIIGTFGWWGAAAAILGSWFCWKSQRHAAILLAGIFLMTGPIFLYLANMPPNTHALAIVEASYLVPDIIVAIAVGFGCGFVSSLNVYAPIIFVPFLILNSMSGFERASKRHNLYARDYVINVFRSAPRNAVVVFHKDVQLFSLWAAQLVEGKRPDVSLLADGLSGSPWYWEMKRRWKTAPSPEISLKDPGGWQRLSSSLVDRALLAGYDVELSERDALKLEPHGLLLKLNGPSESTNILSDFCLYRGKYVYGQTPDFFSTDLIGDSARAHHQMGFYWMGYHNLDLADWYMRRAESLDPTFPRASGDRGYIAFSKGDVAKAYAIYQSAARKADHTVDLAAQYKSLPEVAASCRSEDSLITTQWGAMAERLGRRDEGRQLYERALGIQENAQAHYNLAVTYWGTDWDQVIAHMRRAVELNPQMQEARAYLAKAQMMQGKR